MRSLRFLLPATLLVLVSAAGGEPPAWWALGDPPVVDATATANNKGPANIGQAKWMASEALRALDSTAPAISAEIRSDLASSQPDLFTIPTPKDAAWIDKQKAPLLIGQLKAISDPFYTRLNAAAPSWLEDERNANGTGSPGSIFPWTVTTADDKNTAIANIGQLKGVFSLRFDSLPQSARDADGDGMPDVWEIQQFASLAHGATTDADDDGLTDLMEFSQGTDPWKQDSDGDGINDADEIAAGTNPSNRDTDGDLIGDGDDADPKEILIDWQSVPESSFALLEIDVPADAGSPMDINDKGEVLFSKGIWSGGTWSALPEIVEEREVSSSDWEVPDRNEFSYEVTDTYWQNFGPNDEIVGRPMMRVIYGQGSVADDVPLIAIKSPTAQAITTTQAMDWDDPEGPRILDLLGMDAQGRIFASKSSFISYPNHELWILDSSFQKTGQLALPAGTRVRSYTGNVSSTGWLAARLWKQSEQVNLLGVWNPQGDLQALPAGHGNGYYEDLHLTSIQNSKTVLSSTRYPGGISEVFIPAAAGSMAVIPSLSDKNITTFAGNGTAITSDGQLWRNGKLIPMRSLCEKYAELEGEGYTFTSIATNKDGVILIQAEDANGNITNNLLLPVEFSVYPVAENSDDTVKISADDAEQELAAVILVPDMSQGAQSGSLIEAEDGTVIEWELTEGNGTISTQQTTTTDGVAVTTLTISTTPGDTYKIEAKVTTLKWNGDSFDLGDTGLVAESDLLEVVPGKAATIEVIKSKVEYSSDATDEVEIEITVKDQHENLLEDRTPVTWILDKSTGGFAKNEEGEEQIQSELINGKAKVSLRAPTMPVDQNLIVIVDGLTEEIPMTVNRVTGSISSSAASLDVHAGGNATITVNASAADETPVYWFTSNGSITPAAGSLSSGQATATLSATGGRIGKTVVTATVGDRMFIWEGSFTSSAPVQVSFENPFLIGGVQPGGEPPQNGNGDDYEGPWFILTKGMIRAPGFGSYPATVTVPNGGALVQVTGLDGNSQIMLDKNGYAEFQVASVGTPNQFGRINIQVQVNPPGAAYVEIVETTPWTHVGDFFGGLIGLDTSTGTGVVTSIVGGYIIIGDVGAIVKNSVRNAGWSDKEPNNFELAMAAGGLVSTLSGPADGIVTTIRTIIQRIGNSPLTDVLWRIAKRIITEAKLPTAAEQAFITMMKNDEVFSQAAKDVLTDDKLFSQAARGLEKLGDPFANAVKHAATTNGIGTETAKKIVATVDNLSDDVLDGLKNSGKLDDALEGITIILDKAVADPKLLGKLLENPNAFSAIYKQADLLQDAKRLFEGSPNAQGMEKLFSEIADQSDTWLGRTMEFVAAADVGGAGKLVKVTGRLDNLDKSFIDIIATDSIIQVKTTYQAIREAGKRGFQNAGLPNVNRTMLYLSISKQIAREAAQLELPFKVIVGNGQLASFPAEVTQFAQEAGILLQETTKKIK